MDVHGSRRKGGRTRYRRGFRDGLRVPGSETCHRRNGVEGIGRIAITLCRQGCRGGRSLIVGFQDSMTWGAGGGGRWRAANRRIRRDGRIGGKEADLARFVAVAVDGGFKEVGRALATSGALSGGIGIAAQLLGGIFDRVFWSYRCTADGGFGKDCHGLSWNLDHHGQGYCSQSSRRNWMIWRD